MTVPAHELVAGQTLSVSIEIVATITFRTGRSGVRDQWWQGLYLGGTAVCGARDHKQDVDLWWGDVGATVAYAKEAVPAICRQWGGDPAQVILVGHSRGAIACNLSACTMTRSPGVAGHDSLSHYDDGHVGWGMTPEEQAARRGLRRVGIYPAVHLRRRASPKNHPMRNLWSWLRTERLVTFAGGESELGLVPMIDREGTRKFVTKNHPQGHYTFAALPYVNHTPDNCCGTSRNGSNAGLGPESAPRGPGPDEPSRPRCRDLQKSRTGRR